MTENSPERNEELRAVIALGVLAGTLALIQIWTTSGASILPYVGGADKWGIVPYQSVAIVIALLCFAGYIMFIAIWTAFDSVEKLKAHRDWAKSASHLLFFVGSFDMLALAILVGLRLLAGHV